VSKPKNPNYVKSTATPKAISPARQKMLKERGAAQKAAEARYFAKKSPKGISRAAAAKMERDKYAKTAKNPPTPPRAIRMPDPTPRPVKPTRPKTGPVYEPPRPPIPKTRRIYDPEPPRPEPPRPPDGYEPPQPPIPKTGRVYEPPREPPRPPIPKTGRVSPRNVYEPPRPPIPKTGRVSPRNVYEPPRPKPAPRPVPTRIPTKVKASTTPKTRPNTGRAKVRGITSINALDDKNRKSYRKL